MADFHSVDRRAFLTAGLGSVALLAVGCGSGTSGPRGATGMHEFHGPTMGTSYTLKIFAPQLSEDRRSIAHGAVRAAFDGVVLRMSTYDPASELSRFNAHANAGPFAMSQDTIAVFALAESVSAATDGAFDITVAPVVDAWGFGPGRQQRVPAHGELGALRREVGHRMLTVDAASGTVAKAGPQVRADLSGIAKGFAVDRAARALDDLGLERYMIEAGGEVRARGLNAAGRPWQIAVERPDAFPQRAHFIVPLDGLSMATSGDYRIYFEADGRRYCHEMDPATGSPITNHVASATVVANDCAYADAMATALIVMGADRGCALAEREGIAAYFIVRELGGAFSERQSPAFAALGGRPASRVG